MRVSSLPQVYPSIAKVRMKQFIFYLALITLNSARIALAQANSINDIVREALNDNPEVVTAEAELAAAKGERRTAGQWKNPEISVEYGEKRVTDGMGDLSAKGNSQSYSIAQTFEFPGKASLRKAIANRNIQLAQLAFDQLRLEVAARARFLGIEWVTANQEASAAREVADRSTTLVKMLGRRVPAGVQSLLDQRIIEASMVDIETRAREAEERRDHARIALNVLRRRSSQEPLNVGIPAMTPPAIKSWEVLWTEARQSSFILRTKDLETDRAAKSLIQARVDAAPDLTIGPFFSKENAPDNEKVLGISATLPLPIWDWNRGKIDTAKARLKQTGAGKEQTLRSVEQELAEAYAAYLAIQRQLERYPVSQLDRLREGAELADRQYRLGAVQVQTYLDMEDQYLAALSGTLGTLREAHERFLKIQLVTSDATLLPISNPGKQP